MVLAIALVVRYQSLGGPYATLPETVQDHVERKRPYSADAIVLCRRAAGVLPRGADVTVIRPSEKPSYDVTHYLTAAGLLPYHHVVAPNLDARRHQDLPRYVITIGQPLDHPAYRLMTRFPEGDLYERKR